MAWGATCVQRLNGSRDSAIHTKYRISLRSSSMREPRYPLPRVILNTISFSDWAIPRVSIRFRPPRDPTLSQFIFLGTARAGVRYCAAAAAARGATGANKTSEAAHPWPSLRGRRLVVKNAFAGRSAEQVSTMILPQVHLRKPCYDFSFL